MIFKILGLSIYAAVFLLVSFLGCSNMLEEVLNATAHGSFTINDYSSYTFSRSVILNNDVIDAQAMRFSNDAANWSDWKDYDIEKNWILAYGHSGKTVYGEFRHSNGNIMQISDVITPIIEEKITAFDGAAGDAFSGMNNPGVHGSPLSLSSNGCTLVVGAPGDNSNQGSVYIYKWNENSWIESKLIASDGESGDYFGFSVSTASDGNILVSGSWRDDSNRGAVYVYRLNNGSWGETKIVSSDGEVGDNFGLSVSISADGDTLIAGAYHDAPGGSSYVYKWNGNSWIETKLTSSDGTTGDIYGFHVAVSSNGNILAVGAPGDDSSMGSVYFYKWINNNWTETKITASDREAGDFFGRIVSLSSNGNVLLTGAYKDDISTNTDQGSAYIYRYNGSSWDETKITAADGELTDYFGYSASLSSDGNTMIVGAVSDTVECHTDQGSVYVFNREGNDWNEIKFTSLDGAASDLFGYSTFVSADGNTFAVGAPGADIGSNADQGAVYVY